MIIIYITIRASTIQNESASVCANGVNKTYVKANFRMHAHTASIGGNENIKKIVNPIKIILHHISNPRATYRVNELKLLRSVGVPL